MTLLSRACVSPYEVFHCLCLYLVPFLRYSESKNGETLKPVVGVVQGHWKWRWKYCDDMLSRFIWYRNVTDRQTDGQICYIKIARQYADARASVCWRAIKTFYRATRMHTADYAVARCLSFRTSLCLSVRLSHVGILSKRLNISSQYFHHNVFTIR